MGEPVQEAVITVPAYFNDAQRKATKAAGQLAGLKVDCLLTEPTAAALAYGFVSGDEEEFILVVDLGGGTLDVSLLHSFEGMMEVKAAAGDIWLGGEDFTDLIVQAFASGIKRDSGLPSLAHNAQLLAIVRRQAELAKRSLSNDETAEINISFDGRPFHWQVAREEFEQISEPILAKVRAPLERAIRDARIPASQISRIVFAGGATRMPMFRKLIARLFQQLPIQTINPDEVVARGAAVRAGLLARGAGLEEHVLTDVAPFTLGVAVSNRTESGALLSGLFLPIIERNTVIPASKSHMLNTIADNQRLVRLPIYQGEARMVSDNVYLGELNCSVPEGPAGQEKIEVRFSYDTSGLLDVDVMVLSTKRRENIVIEGNPGLLSKAELKVRLEKLSKLKVHPRDKSENIAAVERARRIYEESLGETREAVASALDSFMAVLEKQDLDQIGHLREQLNRFLDSFDRSPLD